MWWQNLFSNCLSFFFRFTKVLHSYFLQYDTKKNYYSFWIIFWTENCLYCLNCLFYCQIFFDLELQVCPPSSMINIISQSVWRLLFFWLRQSTPNSNFTHHYHQHRRLKMERYCNETRSGHMNLWVGKNIRWKFGHFIFQYFDPSYWLPIDHFKSFLKVFTQFSMFPIHL